MVTTIPFGPVVMNVGRRENKIRYTRSCETEEGKLISVGMRWMPIEHRGIYCELPGSLPITPNFTVDGAPA
jgi:hypothetical protein